MNTAVDSIERVATYGGIPAGPAAAASPSAVSWGAIFAGAAAAAALSLILLLLGTGLGLSSVSPWANEGVSATTLGVSTILWLTFTQLAASAMGGYLAGRLRTKWVSVHMDEVYFRDTAHGFLAWAVATVGTAALLTSAVTSVVGAGLDAGASVAGGASTTLAAAAGGAGAAGSEISEPNAEGPMPYFVDSLFRTEPGERAGAPPEGSDAALAEVTRIFANALRMGALPEEDARYVAGVVAERSDVSEQEAQRRVNETFARLQATIEEAEAAAREAADTAREAAARTALWLFISLLIGAFVASWMATFGGRQRDL
jgi:hypothetical protein